MTTLTKTHTGDRETRKTRLSPARRRGWKRPFAGIAAMVLGGIVATWAAVHEEERTPILVTTGDLDAGNALDVADLRIVPTLGVEELDLVPIDEALQARAAMPIPAGTVLTGPMLADASAWPAAGQAVIEVKTTPGMLPDSAGEGAPLLVVPAEGEPFHARLHSLGEESESAEPQVVELLVAEDDVAGVVRVVGESGTRLVLMAER